MLQLELFIMRGVPGSGKSSLAREMKRDYHDEGQILSTDDFFIRDGLYCFDASKLQEAHQWNIDRAEMNMQANATPIFIDNTNTHRWEAKPYVELALFHNYSIAFIEPHTQWWLDRDTDELARRNTHGVSKQVIQRMIDNWEFDISIDSVLASSR